MTATCGICGEVVTVELLLPHLSDQHPEVVVDIERWPDGGLVIEESPSSPADMEW